MAKFYDFHANDNKGVDVCMKEYEGKVLLVVNTATGCGFTPQYEGLQEIYEKFQARGFEIIDFPCNQFAAQAPGTGEEIEDFCQSRYGVTFRQFEKINVNGPKEHPIYTYLKSEQGGLLSPVIKWNFTKFLIDRNGNVVDRFGPADSPKKIESAIAALL